MTEHSRHFRSAQDKARRSLLEVFETRLKKIIKDIKRLDATASRRLVHELRVLTRRTRATLTIFKHFRHPPSLKRVRSLVKSLTRLLGPIRSLDVSNDLLKKRLRALPKQKSHALKFTLEAFRNQRWRERRSMAKQLRKNKLVEKILLPEGKNLPNPVQLSTSLQRQCKKGQAKAKGALATYRRTANITHLHELRIRLKKWRYLLELSAESRPTNRPDPRIARLKSLQNEIGGIHDLEVLRELLQTPKLKTVARRRGAEKDLQIFTDHIKSEIQKSQRNFLAQHHKTLNDLFSKRRA